MSLHSITLDYQIKKWLLEIAHGRNDLKDLIQTRRKSKEFTDLELDFLGIKGEYVCSIVHNKPFDENSYGRSGDSGVDIWLDDGGYAIKTNHRLGGYLLVERASDYSRVKGILLVDGPCGKGKLCICKQPEKHLDTTEIWRYRGRISVEEFEKQKQYADWGYGPRWYVTQSMLEKR